MIDDIFLAADGPAPQSILGVLVRPLSIWHVWALKASDSAFLRATTHTRDDVVRLLFVCSLTRADYARLNQEPAASELYAAGIALKVLRATEDEHLAALESIKDYFDAGTNIPEFWAREKSDPVKDRLRCPVEWHLAALMVEMGVSANIADAWDVPLVEAKCWQAVYSERNGSRDYVDQKDRNDFQKSKEAGDV